jgi:hypothetical protein
MEMRERFLNAIKDAQFTLFEWQGFKEKPRLALEAGMAIGYKMAIKDAQAAREEPKDES